jgi:GNAT superfamily N-acetyltransferase
MLIYNLKEISFDDLLPSWKSHLWPKRKSKIESQSIINHLGHLDHSVLQYQPYFWGVFHDDKIVGVISGMKTSPVFFRSRGLWVHEEFRELGLATELLRSVELRAKENGCKTLWSMPRCRSWGFYERIGFKIQFKLENYEFGPHYIAYKSLS